jgi:hypothetical protein
MIPQLIIIFYSGEIPAYAGMKGSLRGMKI